MENQKSTVVPFESSQDIGKLFEALSKAQGAMDPAVLDKINPHFNSKFASLKSVKDAIKIPFAENGLTTSQQVFSHENNYYVRTVLGHTSGQWTANTVKLLLSKQDMQGLGSAISYAKRYSIAAVAGVVDDDDGNAAVGREEKPKQKSPSRQTVPDRNQSQPKKDPPKAPGKSNGVYLIDINNSLLKGKTLEQAHAEFGTERLGNLLDAYKQKDPANVSTHEKIFVTLCSKFFSEKKIVLTQVEKPVEKPVENITDKLKRLQNQYVPNGSNPVTN